MKLQIHGSNLEVTDSIRAYVEHKIGGAVDHFFPDRTDKDVAIHVSKQNRNHGIRIKLHMGELTFAAEADTEDLYSSIDLAEEKLKRQFRKYKTKINRKTRREAMRHHKVSSNKSEKLKVTKLCLKPMSGDEAIDQMNQRGHSFFVFCDEETDQICVVYKIKNEAYGILAANAD